ncbi:hypothetical protein [Micromonospora aurantiaca]|uniref:Uncharacterized protein n=1 Tax=Micromonospora aurantiaca (nom. illeg.) TaxID=47850 RepID=A0ABQ6UEY9_9ACTN|nr:hypothetical protein [Micromonospora aurantiaca]KAB1110908.1 hypothetical protein F6X54_17165 [Micromonospora aurantiaca]UFN96966.1 hypothetical protein LF814_12900 [Micromonospora aurantiaca]
MQLRELVDAVTGDEPPMGRTVDDIVAAGRRAERRRRNRFATAGAAGLVAVAVAAAITVPTLDARRTSSALSEAPRPGVSPWPDASPFTFTFTGYDAGTLHVQDPIVVSTAYQIASVYSDRHTSNDKPVSQDEAEAFEQERTAAGAKPTLWAYLTVYRPGAFDPAAVKDGRSVTVAGRRAVQATLPFGLDPRNPVDPGNKLFAWEYAHNAWAAVTSISGDAATPSFADLSGLVAGLKPAGPTPAPLPFTVGYLPRGYVPLQVGTHAMPGLSGIATARAGDYGGATYTRPPLRTSGLTAPFDSVEGGIRDGFHIFVTPSTSSNQSPEPGATKCYPGAARGGGFCNIWSADGTVVVQVSSEGVGGRLPQAELLRIAEGITVADDVRDESTWTPAPDALTP